jgi:uncharacterized protein YneF (UPF0154 family)
MDFKTVLKTILIVEMVVSLLVGVFIGVYVSKPIVRDNTIVEVNLRDSTPQFQKNSIREWVIPYNTGDKTQSKFGVIETEIQGQSILIIWREGYAKDFKVITKKNY